MKKEIKVSSEKTYSRRELIGGLGIAMTAAAIGAMPTFSSAFAKTPDLPKVKSSPEPLIDPTTRYPKPPFESQLQTWPGLAGKMHPKPDHGETSYVGSGRLRGAIREWEELPQLRMRAKVLTWSLIICRLKSPTPRRSSS